MAVGDKAAAKGYIVPPDTQPHSQGALNDRQALDYLADEVDARYNNDAGLAQQITSVYNVVQTQAATIAQMREHLDSLIAALSGKENALGFTPVRQTNDQNQIGFRFVNGVGVIARINDQTDYVVS
jgi:hypothetical protein